MDQSAQDYLWCEKYRPKKIDDCVLPDRIKSIFKEFVNRGGIPHLILSGTSGTGKTTVAKALCEELNMDYLMLNGSDENGIDTFRMKIKNYASSMSLTGNKKVIILDEADYLNPNSIQPALRGALEEFEDNCRFIFTCNYKNRLIDAIHSRCTVIDYQLKPEEKVKIATDFMRRVEFILNFEKVSFTTKVLAEFITKYFPDFRRVLNELQTHSIANNNVIDNSILSRLIDVRLNDLVVALKEKKFSSMRQWVAQYGVSEGAGIYRKIYDCLFDLLNKDTIPPVIVCLAKYQYQAAFAVDQELNLTACLTEIMSEAEFV